MKTHRDRIDVSHQSQGSARSVRGEKNNCHGIESVGRRDVESVGTSGRRRRTIVSTQEEGRVRREETGVEKRTDPETSSKAKQRERK